jgi:hypothetical protein
MIATETLFSIQDEINRGEFSFQQIADMYGVTLTDVDHVFMEMIDMEREAEEYELYMTQECEYDT